MSAKYMSANDMSDCYSFTILGCGSSPGVPRPNGDFGACNPDNPKNHRYRTSLLVERIAKGKKTTVVIDTGPDFRAQMIDAKVSHIDGVVYTHAHADHIHGIDDLRSYSLLQSQRMNIYADLFTFERLNHAFGYCFQTPKGSKYPPILNHHGIHAQEKFSIAGAAGAIDFMPFYQQHGDIHSLGFRIGSMAYCTDVSDFPDETLPYLQNLDVLIIGALQYKPHPNHFSLEQAVAWINHLNPKRAILTHMHIALDYDMVMRQTADYIEPAYQGLNFTLPYAKIK